MKNSEMWELDAGRNRDRGQCRQGSDEHIVFQGSAAIGRIRKGPDNRPEQAGDKEEHQKASLRQLLGDGNLQRSTAIGPVVSWPGILAAIAGPSRAGPIARQEARRGAGSSGLMGYGQQVVYFKFLCHNHLWRDGIQRTGRDLDFSVAHLYLHIVYTQSVNSWRRN